MKKLEYQVQFTTPAFLGNAEQDGQWRTPPFKALLRQWWRVAYAAGRHHDPALLTDMHRREGELFGNAWLHHEEHGRTILDHCKSAVRLRLSRWDPGRQRTWQSLQAVHHPEVKFPVDSGLYLGFGPVVLPKGAKQPALKRNAAIQPGESATLALAVPDASASVLRQAIWLMDHYGTVGGRNRNGWGSFSLEPATAGTDPLVEPLDPAFVRPWRDCLHLDWPHAVGRDTTGPLIWQTEALPDWKAVMVRLARVKIDVRTQFRFPANLKPPHFQPLERHWLSYPITTHWVKPWGKNLRLPNSLRFQVRADPDGRLRGTIFHVPCLPPAEFRPDRRVIEGVWQRVHAFLDAPAQQLSRIPQ
jgi:CRISPR-associated protein Cmr1